MTDVLRMLLDEPDPTVFLVKLAGLAIFAGMWLFGMADRPRETFLEWKARMEGESPAETGK